MLASALVPEKLSAIRRCPLFGVSAIGRFLKYSIYGKRSWYIAHCPLYGRCPLFGVSAKVPGKTGCACANHLLCLTTVPSVQSGHEGPLVQTECGHHFCKECLESFFALCPLEVLDLDLQGLWVLWLQVGREIRAARCPFRRV